MSSFRRWLAVGGFCLSALASAGESAFLTDFDGALAEAAKSKRPLLVDFFGIWCPPCNELDELVFSHPDFRAKQKAFVAVKLDADAPASWKAKDKYKVGGYPTVLFLKPDGREIERIVGFRPRKDFLAVMDRAAKPGARSLDEACRRKEPEHLLRCVQMRAERKEHKAAMAAFTALEKKLKPGSFEFVEAASAAADLEENRLRRRERLHGLMKAYPDNPRAFAWGAAYLETFEDADREKPDAALLRSLGDHLKAQLADPRRGEIGLVESDIYELRAHVLSTVNPELSKSFWADAALALENAAKEAGRESPGRGFVLERIGCLERAGRENEALELAETYKSKYPDEFTFHYRIAALRWKKKEAARALEAAETAYGKSYGDNKLRVAMLLMELYPANGRPGDAAKIYEEVTAQIRPSEGLDVRTHRYLKQLKEARDRYVAAGGTKKP